MPHFRKKLLLVLLLLTIFDCWKKQDHEIAAPKIPVYTITGKALDMDSADPLVNVIVSITAVDLMYDTDFVSAVDTTDNMGHFSFEGISPGTYFLIAYRQSFPVVEENIVVEHADKNLDLALPKYLLARRCFSPPYYPHFTGIFWKSADVLAGVTIWQEHGDDPRVSTIIQGNFTDGFHRLGANRYTLSNPLFYALAYSGRYWTTDGNSPYTTVYSIDNAKGNVEGATRTKFTIRDLTSDKQNIWASTDLRKIVKFGNHPSIVEEMVDVPAEQPYGIAWSGTNMWLYDFGSGLLLDLKENYAIRNSYRVFGWDEINKRLFPIYSIKYLAFDYAGNLWGCDDACVYEFLVK